ncbi:hypothetical protein ABZY44_23420 [Streptomyces sp. NPDC006544]|uniref:zinc finger domain-containing protein n=1 Tax=Streptomyces sp. NPDC006544 TaxID=3154583 RepID=UPI0033B1FDC4
MEYFALTSKTTGHDPADVEPALRRAWDACAAVPCPKCHVAAGQYCRNPIRGIWYVTRFHKPRQTAADVPSMLGPVGVHGLSWARGTGVFAWDDRLIPAAP